MSSMESVLSALADAPMRIDGLLHELGGTERGMRCLLTRLKNANAASVDDAGLWHAIARPGDPAIPAPLPAATRFDALLPSTAAPAGNKPASSKSAALAKPTATVKAAPKARPAAPPPAVSHAIPLHLVDIVADSTSAERILAVLLLSGRLRRCDVERAAALVSADA
jgi:hypothetical protein